MIKQAYFRGLTKAAFFGTEEARRMFGLGLRQGRNGTPPYPESKIPRRGTYTYDQYRVWQEGRRRGEYERQRRLRQQTAESPVITYGNVTLRPTAAQNQAVQRAVNAYNAAKGVLNGERPATIPLPGGASADVKIPPAVVDKAKQVTEQLKPAVTDKAKQVLEQLKQQGLKRLPIRFGW